MPYGLNIDYKRQLYGISPYHDHILINTGTADWPSRIENEEKQPLARIIKSNIRKYHLSHPPNVDTTLLVTNSSLGEAASANRLKEASISIIRAGLHIKLANDADSIAAFTADLLQYMEGDGGTNTSLQTKYHAKRIEEVIILICGHANRDVRCGVMGPLLEKEFREKLEQRGYAVVNRLDEPGSPARPDKKRVVVGLVSHLGGHAFAGNVIIYLPTAEKFKGHPLAGRGVWYGRVEPSHVEGIVDKTVQEGTVIEELLRGIV
jgi:hypothetical protein